MHKTIKYAFASSFLLLIAVTSVMAQETEKKSTQLQIDLGSGDFINDRAVYENLSKVGKELLKDDSLLKSAEILGQLDELAPSVKLNLPKVTGEKSRKRSFDSTVIVGFLFDCGKCDQKHVGLATGVAISSDGLILTNHHVFDGDSKFIHFVVTRDGKVYPVEKVLAAHEDNDIALLKIAATDLTFSPIAPNVPQPLDDLYTIGHPERNFFYASTGQVARYVEREKGSVKSRWMQIDGEFSKGSSGGPVFDSEGNVIGLMTRQLPKLAEDGHLRIMFHECVPVQVINDFVSGKLVNANSIAGFKKKLENATDKGVEQIYSSLMKEQRSTITAFYRSRRKAGEDKSLDMKKLEREFNSDMETVNKKMLLLADVQNESVSIDAFTFILTSNETKVDKKKITKRFLDRHLDSSKIPGKLELISRGFLTPVSASLLEQVSEQGKSEESQGVAKFLLATNTMKTGKYYARQIKSAAFVKSKGDDIGFYRNVVETSADDLAEMLGSVKEDYGQVEFRNSTLGKLASLELKKLKWAQDLEVGKVAPEIEGPDLDGKTFKLSDYRGKVVMLDFWGDW